MKQVWPRLFNPRRPAARLEPLAGTGGQWHSRFAADPCPASAASKGQRFPLQSNEIDIGEFKNCVLPELFLTHQIGVAFAHDVTCARVILNNRKDVSLC